MFWILFPLFGTAASCSLIFAGWRIGGPSSRWFSVLGWVLAVVSVYLWSIVVGWEYGSVYAFGIASITAWLLALTNVRVRPTSHKDQARTDPTVPPISLVSQHVLLFVLVFLLSGASSIVVSLSVSRWTVVGDVNRLALVFLLFPAVWGVLAYWATVETRIIRAVVGITALGVTGFGLLVV